MVDGGEGEEATLQVIRLGSCGCCIFGEELCEGWKGFFKGGEEHAKVIDEGTGG